MKAVAGFSRVEGLNLPSITYLYSDASLAVKSVTAVITSPRKS